MRAVGGLNFFAPYIDHAQSTRKRLIYISFSIFFIFLILGGIYIVNFLKVHTLQKEIAGKESYLASPEILEQINEMNQLKEKISAMQRYKNIVEEIDEQLAGANIINGELMNTVASTLPRGVVFDNLNITITDFSLSGTATSKDAIAELEYNLKRTGLFAQVHVNSISSEQSSQRNFVFSLAGIFN